MKITVDQQGYGDYKTVQEAIDALPEQRQEAALIEIKNGEYREKITIGREKGPIHIIGESPDKTILVYSDNAHTLDDKGQPLGTFRSGSFYNYAHHFTAENLTIRNDSGPRTGQAVAAFIDADRAAFRNVRFEGDQDTLYIAGGRHYFESCYIEGDVDFIFGPATAVFNRCTILCKRTGGYLTAANTPEHEPYGYVFLDCKVRGGRNVENVYLGRPWRDFAAVAFIRTDMDASIIPEGWHNWSKPERESTSRYAEYGSYGPGANPEARVPWSRQLSDLEASRYTIEEALSGKDGWHPVFVQASASIDK
ncbi:pectinesterase family protein [Marinicrinis lubricantis]